MLLKKLSIYLGTGAPNKADEFLGFCASRNVMKKIFFYVSKNRYISYELLARNIVDSTNYDIINDFFKLEEKAGYTSIVLNYFFYIRD